MNSIVVTSTKQNIKFGYEGEDNVTKIIFPYDESWLEYGEGNFEVRILRCGDEVAYTATEVLDDRQAMTLTMTVTDIELSVRGRGEMQLCYVCPDSIKKSPIYQYTVNRSVDYKYAVDPPEGSIIASVEKSLSEIKNTTNRLSNSVISIESSIDDVNSQIDNINDKISEFDEEIDSIGDVETRVGNLETSVQSINGRINTAEGNINENTESISNLNESVTELDNRKVTDLETSGGKSDSGKYLTVGTDGKVKATSLVIPTITVDASLSTTSTNPVQNKVIKTELNNINSNIATCNTEISKINGSLGNVRADLGDKSNLKTLDKTNIVSAINSLNGIVRIIANRDTSWAGIRENVKSGYGEILYPVGTDFSVSCPSGAPYNDIVFTVVNHRVENDEPIMTLLMKRCIYGIQFDAIQAAFVASEAMAAGTYHFKLLDGYDTGYDGGKYVQFTIVNPLVAGDQIVITWTYNQSWIGKNAYVYHAFDTTPVETCIMSEGQGGTYLGVADGSSANLNHTHRLRYGSNNWKESAVREWLNSDAQAGEWQTQQTRFQRPCSYALSKAGFISYLDPSFVAVVRTGTHLNRTNQVFDLLGTKVAYSTDERFFLLSSEEIGFTSESGIVCGSLFSFYDGANNDDRIKYDITSEDTARYWWLRTPIPSDASHERSVYSSGALYSGNAYSGVGAAAACEI